MQQNVQTEYGSFQPSEEELNIDKLNHQAYQNRYLNPVDTIESAEKALNISQKILYKNGEYTALMNLAFANFILSRDYPILQNLTKAYNYFKTNKKIPEYPIVLNYLGNVYDNFGEYQKGLSFCQEALNYTQDHELKEIESDALSTIGLIMSRISDYTGAINSFKKSYNIRNSLNNFPAMASSLNLLARTYALNNQFDLSEKYYWEAIEIRTEHNETNALPWSYIGLASLYEKKNEYIKAIEYYSKSLELNNKAPDKRCSLHCFLGLSKIYINNDYNKSREYITKTLQTAQELGANPILYEAYEILSQYYEKNGEMEEAYAAFKKYHQIRESVLNSQTHSMLKNQQMTFEIEKVQKDAEIHQLRNIELKEAYSVLEKRTKEILDSIDYAKNIQNAILPLLDHFHLLFPESFVYYNPKDIVSGDFYWCYENGSRIFVAAADCTGHGVPGGFMSILGISLLNEIVSSCNTYCSDTLLNELRKRIISSLRQSSSSDSIKDGMDIALCCIDKEKQIIEFSGAYNPIYIIFENELSEIKGNRMPIGIFDESQTLFQKNIIPIKKGMSIYMFSDGFMDQFGGTKGKKMKAKKFRDLILSISSSPIKSQNIFLDQAFLEWSEGYEQVDDILVLGIKF